MHQDLLEYVSSQMTFDAIMKAEMNSRWPLEPRAAGKRSFNLARRKREVKTTTSGSLVRWIAYAMKCAKGGHGALPLPGIDPLRNIGTFGQEKRAPIKRPHIFDRSSYP
jgi:hypothetical protein